MTETLIVAQPITAEAFAPFGDLLDCAGPPDKMINQGLCGRFHDRGRLEFDSGKVGISLFQAEPREVPLNLEMVERHPLGSQAFIPMHQNPFLVIVAPDKGGQPGRPEAYVTKPGQGINFLQGTWHGVLTPLAAPGLFAVVDRIGEGTNLEEHWFSTPYVVRLT